jgi:hypothetical protein
MAAHKFYNNFTAGEWTPLLDGRSDLEKYDAACRTLENFRVLPYGGVRFRAGTRYVATAKDGATRKTRLVPFQFSVSTRFVLQFGHQSLRFLSNGVQVMSGGSPYEVTTPYDEADLFGIQVKQINDVMYLVHPSYAPRKLSRLADTNWTLVEVAWAWPALMEENTTDTTLTVSNADVGSGRTMTASAPLFVASHVGAYWELRHLREASSVVLNIAGSSGTVTSSVLTVKGDWTVTTSNYWYGTLEVQRSEDNGSTWETVRMFKGSSDRNVSASGSQVKEAQLRLRYAATGDPFGSGVWQGTAPTNYVRAKATLESQEAYVAGLVKVTGYTSPTVVTVDVVDALAATTATKVWSEGAWSPKRGYPRAIGLFEQRLYFGGTASNPIRFWGSHVGDFENFEYGDTDDAAVAFDMASTESNAIQWMEALEVIQVGTSGGEFVASSGNRDEPVTPSNVAVRGQSAYGADYLQAITINDVVLFVQRQGRRVREMSYNIERDRYVAPDLTLLAEHVTAAGIVQLAFTRQPDPLLLVVTADGALAVLTYNREQNITAWTRWTTNGAIESVASLYGTPEDEVWLVVRRTINGATVRFIERMAVETDVKADAVHLDASVTGTTAGANITGLAHLNGATVRAVVNGAVAGDYTVVGGAITVSGVTTFGKFVVGLPYVGTIKPMKLDIGLSNGPSQGRKRRILEVAIRFNASLGARYGRDAASLDAVEFRAPENPGDASPPLFTGDKIVSWPPGYDRSADIIISQQDPLPCTVLGLAVKWDVFGD